MEYDRLDQIKEVLYSNYGSCLYENVNVVLMFLNINPNNVKVLFRRTLAK